MKIAMISDALSQRRVPRRKDRLIAPILSVLYIPIIFGVAFLVVKIPLGDIIPSEYVSWFYLAIVVLVIFALNFGQHKAWQHVWQVFSEENGLKYETEKPALKALTLFHWPRITGVFQGFPITIYHFTQGSGKYKKIYTAITLAFNSHLEDGLEISSKGWLSGVKNLIAKNDSGYQNVSLDDEALERKIVVKSTQDRFARSVLSAYSIKQGLLEIESQSPDIKIIIKDKSIYYQERSNIMDRGYMLAVINVLREIASSVERYGHNG